MPCPSYRIYFYLRNFFCDFLFSFLNEGVVWMVSMPRSSLKIHLPNDFAPKGSCACTTTGNEFPKNID